MWHLTDDVEVAPPAGKTTTTVSTGICNFSEEKTSRHSVRNCLKQRSHIFSPQRIGPLRHASLTLHKNGRIFVTLRNKPPFNRQKLLNMFQKFIQ